MMQRKGDILFAVLFGGGFLLLGLVCLSWSVPDLWQGMRSYTWPSVNGRVIFVSNGTNRTSTEAVLGKRPPLLYEYSVQGRRYIGSRIAFDGLQHRGRSARKRIGQKYTRGDAVKVYHNPRQARSSTLAKGLGAFILIPLIFGISGLVLSALVLMGTFIPAPHQKLHPTE